ncbi:MULTISPECIES: branched-chain amino acid aminotransferase [Stappiaceae]|jgi:branched-chain amino acid aminotransferase|uniref:Probable branched-chain-amino-acid aminotransferase n=1 Tax=Roseibium aggregatum TaxID=187304 RepID=A0A0M6XYG2_9HYPH|nr:MULTISPECIES: branched-chain amino acid aminotransferase [Stappiaceae]MCR9284901.1 branched-chain amino acid aminotransferase [Paracoccaceae bacterium]MEC9401330.1 branched-chain amino acid aminotransferase [Pseudomonadota bacterium]MBN8182403.1 branched-chain amino acid aminotransferase [Roseibium aggregatum]MBO6859247.1 branched-chain amino acid aminotransferase [Roseibium sp.]MBO9459304.1 branched-chain amino acid aminotransferase [Labrenzia sp. R5_0]
MSGWSDTWTWIDGTWHEGNPPIMGPRTHASWLGSSVFDGARFFEGVMPDIDLHCKRVNDSAVALGMKPTMKVGEMVELTKEGCAKFGGDQQIYVKPMYWVESDGPGVIVGDPDSTRFCLCLFDAPMAPKDAAMSITLSPFRRPTVECMPVNAKAGCLYPNNARAMLEAKGRGFDNAVVRDMLGNVAELTSANIFMAKEGKVHTPVPNGTFLNGITRQRVIQLLRSVGYDVFERTMDYGEFLEADEIFSTGNYSKVTPVKRIEERDLQPGPIAARARELYWEFSHA